MSPELRQPIGDVAHRQPWISLAQTPHCFPELCVVLAASSNGMLIVDARQADHPIVYANPAFERLTGYTRAELIGQNARLLQGPETTPAACATIRAALGAGQSCQVTIRNYRKDGQPFWNELIIAPVRSSDGTLTHFVGLQTDVSARLEAEQERDRLFALSLDLLCVARTDGTFTRVNPAFTATLGYSAEELLARPFFELVHPDDLAATQAALQVLRAVPVAHFVNRYRHQDGSYRWLEWNAQPLSEQGLIYAVARDITAQVAEAATQREHEQQRMQAQKLESLGLLTSGIAHDFNNLLSVIQGNIDLALLDLPPEHPARASLRQGLDGVDQASDLIRLLLTYAGRSQPAARPLDLNALILELLALLRSSIPPAIRLRPALGAGLPAGLLDAGQTRQVVMNLVLNAVDAIGAGPGEVVLTTRACVLARAELDTMLAGEACVPGPYLRLDVADTGAGMEAHTLLRIFEPFFSTKPRGRGLGLATVLGLVRVQGGALRVQSSRGAGTIFTIYFPLAAANVEAPAVPALG